MEATLWNPLAFKAGEDVKNCYWGVERQFIVVQF